MPTNFCGSPSGEIYRELSPKETIRAEPLIGLPKGNERVSLHFRCRGVYLPDNCTAIIDAVDAVDRVADVSELTRLLVV